MNFYPKNEEITYTISNNTATFANTNKNGCIHTNSLDLTILTSPTSKILQVESDLEVTVVDMYMEYWRHNTNYNTIHKWLVFCVGTDINGCIGDTSFF